MKKITMICLMLLSLYQVKAQEVFGKATFTVPAGWQSTRTATTITMENAAKKGVVCKIIISTTEKGGVITDAEYLQYRTLHGGTGITYQNRKVAVTKYEAEGLISFFSKGSTTQQRVPVQSYFYSLSNGKQTLYYQLLTNNNSCISEFNQFMATLTMELEQTEQGQANARARKAAPAAPAAPAPMM
ncbi:MAG: hypothetical protein EOP53_02890 [Sphingobacteriales bacterium]|nr:MAG: hypothetical protein EOP53_02890 [Sphingobacteriales bacterium]